MASSEAARNDLYNGLIDTLGPERAETLMTYLPDYKPSEVATEKGLRESMAVMEKSLRESMAVMEKSLRESMAVMEKSLSEMKAELVVMNKRIDRVFVTLATGMFVIFASVMGVLGVVIAGIT